MSPLLYPNPHGLYCPAAQAYVDPDRAVDLAIITHGHSDHARRGHKLYICSPPCAPILRHRLGKNIQIETLDWGEKRKLHEAWISLHPAGHLLGSAQVRVEHNDEVWIASGDYKRLPDPSCRPFEVVPCDTFITEATFATPIHRWPDPERVFDSIMRWWTINRSAGMTSVLHAYSLGKAQRLLAHLAQRCDERIFVADTIEPHNAIYRQQGITLPQTTTLSRADKHELQGAMVIAPPRSSQLHRLPDWRGAFASGWMHLSQHRSKRGYAEGFVLSDHADFPRLLQTIDDCQASQVLVTHGPSDALRMVLDPQRVTCRDLEELRAEPDQDPPQDTTS